jgi:hypothetical protein
MDYFKTDIEPTIQKLRTHYTNDNSFKNYMNILVVISSHLKSLNKSVYQTLTKTNIFMNNEIQSKRELNEVAPEDEGKIISLDKDDVYKNIEGLDKIDDRLIYALYTLMPARRLEWRSVKLTAETNINKLNDVNYLIASTTPKQIVFNDYKTYKAYGKQILNIPADLDEIINRYIHIRQLKHNDYLFSLLRNKQEYPGESNFSAKVSSIFKKVYGIPISIRFIRMSWVSHLMQTNPSTKLMKEMAYYMAHSTQEQSKYNKILK